MTDLAARQIIKTDIPSVSIVIATANRPQFVLDCIMSFKDQLPDDVEIVIVDAGDENQVDEKSLKEVWVNYKLIRFGIMNASLQRNEGVRKAGNDIIIFMDDDCYVQPGWWPAIIIPFKDKTVGAVAGGYGVTRIRV